MTRTRGDEDAGHGIRVSQEAIPGGAPTVRTFRRSSGQRFLSIACAVIFPGGAASMLLENGFTIGASILLALSLLSLANLTGAYADRYTLGESGVQYENRLLGKLGVRPRYLAWEDVARVREHRRLSFGRPEASPSTLFLFPRSGRRMVLDSLERFDEVLEIVRRRCPPGARSDGGA